MPWDQHDGTVAGAHARRRTGGAVAKYVALGETLVAQGRASEARKAAAAAEGLSKSTEARVPAARIYLRAGAEAEARRIVDELAGQLQPEKRAYARMIDAEIALACRRPADAVEALLASRKFVDLCLARFGRVRGSHLGARSRRAALMFLDDGRPPTTLRRSNTGWAARTRA